MALNIIENPSLSRGFQSYRCHGSPVDPIIGWGVGLALGVIVGGTANTKNYIYDKRFMTNAKVSCTCRTNCGNSRRFQRRIGCR